MSTTSNQPRIVAFDVARCLAIVGMVIVNYKIILVSGEPGPPWLAAFADAFTGRAVATFVVLAGIGVSLLSRRGRESGDPERVRTDRIRLLKRAAFLFVFGVLYAPIWPADILHFYGVYLVIAVLLLNASGRMLWAAAITAMLIFLGLLVTFDYSAGWEWSTLTYTDFWTAEGFVRHLFFNGFHPVFPWVAFMLVGMWLGRLDFHDPGVRRRLAVVGAVVVAATELLSWWLKGLITAAPDVDPEAIHLVGTSPIPPMPLYLLSGGGTAVMVIALVAMLTARFGDAGWMRPFIAAGQLAFTLYVAHVVVGIGLLEELDAGSDQTLSFALGYSALFCVIGILFAWAWRQRFRQGPFEWLMRRLT
ncbi:MAG: DUF418 domain-containing protein [Acidobacteriota bacterium]